MTPTLPRLFWVALFTLAPVGALALLDARLAIADAAVHNERVQWLLGSLWLVVPLIGASLGFLLSKRGVLPGTQRPSASS